MTPKTTPQRKRPTKKSEASEPATGSQSDDKHVESQQPELASSGTKRKLAMHVKEASTVGNHRHVRLEIPMPTSSPKRSSQKEEIANSQETNEDEEIFKTPMERRTHVRFDDSDREEFVTPREAPSSNPLERKLSQSNEEQSEDDEDSEEGSDDDEAPEAVSTKAAEAQSMKASEAAAKAAEQSVHHPTHLLGTQAAAQKRKRQERDAFFKEQAKDRDRRRTNPKAPAAEQSDEEASAEDGAEESGQKRKREIPKLLPLELLDSDDDEEDDGSYEPDSAASKKKIKFNREGPAIKDARQGSTVFRVMRNKGNGKLAPKLSKQSRNLKELLLTRDRAPQQPRRGFFVAR
ncbi:hypothetical protein QBC46DRAFT_451126 [Diplogelasinospora grovesii]|uniref:Uncharacterized protein n=1 Tax=Diplogelasinospora grovesii TaxID=303347 RepID=A0AAN6N3Q5_9PEZI|nr:hypothetical protein QBC46DRAFT_451126 [Diplogelasinospora grovesii]